MQTDSCPGDDSQSQNGWVKGRFPFICDSRCQMDLHKGSANLHPRLRRECEAVVFNLKTPGEEELLSKMKIWRELCECLPQRAAPAGSLARPGKDAGRGAFIPAGRRRPGRFPPSGGGAAAALSLLCQLSCHQVSEKHRNLQNHSRACKVTKSVCQVRTLFLRRRHSQVPRGAGRGRVGGGFGGEGEKPRSGCWWWPRSAV